MTEIVNWTFVLYVCLNSTFTDLNIDTIGRKEKKSEWVVPTCKRKDKNQIYNTKCKSNQSLPIYWKQKNKVIFPTPTYRSKLMRLFDKNKNKWEYSGLPFEWYTFFLKVCRRMIDPMRPRIYPFFSYDGEFNFMVNWSRLKKVNVNLYIWDIVIIPQRPLRLLLFLHYYTATSTD